MKSQAKKAVSPKRSRRVFVGLSGGVDSAVSAALLKKDGYEVTGVFIKAWDPSTELRVNYHQKYPCTWKEDRRSAMRAAAILNIPFITLDLEKEYKKEVVDYMIAEYKEGRTPNPDVMCNKEIKFGHFLKFALDPLAGGGADFVATGHYAQTSLLAPLLAKERGRPSLLGRGEVLLEAKDKNKDQSYFLWTLTQEQLKHTLFPIGHLQKEEVRKLAVKFGLPQATRKDSQGLCFLGKIDMKEFLREYIKTKKGDVLNEKGEVIGEHDGAELYTLGERHGFRVFNEKTNSQPLYVVSKDIKKNTLTVASKSSPSKSPRPPGTTPSRTGVSQLRSTRLSSKSFSFQLQNQNWISGETPKGEISCRIRYRGSKIKCRIENNEVFFGDEILMASGQSVVFYKDEICLGGAIMA